MVVKNAEVDERSCTVQNNKPCCNCKTYTTITMSCRLTLNIRGNIMAKVLCAFLTISTTVHHSTMKYKLILSYRKTATSEQKHLIFVICNFCHMRRLHQDNQNFAPVFNKAQANITFCPGTFILISEVKVQQSH